MPRYTKRQIERAHLRRVCTLVRIAQGPVSSDELASLLGVSMAQVKQYVRELRAMGWDLRCEADIAVGKRGAVPGLRWLATDGGG
jgi:predicted DNA-binding transcriptional regulator YafY